MKYSYEFERFEQSFNSCSSVWVDNYDLDALVRLRDGERTLAVNMLIERHKAGDVRAPRAIAEMGAREAVRPLTDNLATFRGEMLVEASMALWNLGGFEGAKSHILRALREDDQNGRIAAAYALRNFRSPMVVQALLFVAETDADRDVRTTAATSLLLMHNIMSSPFDPGQRDLLMRIDSGDRETKKKGITDLYRLIVGQGTSPNPGLPDLSFKPTGDPPMDMVAGMTLRDQTAIRMVAERYRVKILVRPGHEDIVKRIRSREAHPKPEVLRSRTITSEDVRLGFNEDQKGLIACREPNPLVRGTESDEEWRKINDRYKQRLDEFQNLKMLLGVMQMEGKIMWNRDTGLITDAKTGKPFAGDNEVFGYVDAQTGTPVSPFIRNQINKELRALGITQHNEYLGWDYSGASDVPVAGKGVSEFGTKAGIDFQILNGHVEGNPDTTPLIACNPLTGKWEKTWYSGRTQRTFVEVTRVGDKTTFSRIRPGRLI